MAELEPLVTIIADGIEYAYNEHHEAWPFVQLRHFYRDKSGNLLCELSVACIKQGFMSPISGVKFNLSNLQNRRGIVRGIQEAALTTAFPPDWPAIINDICWRGRNFYNDGLGLQEIWPTEEVIQPAYLIRPVLPLNLPTTIFGDPGAGKLHIALTIAIIAQLPFNENKLGFSAPIESVNVLYLDYENSEKEFQRKLSELCRGFNVSVGIRRLSLKVPLPDNTERIQKIVWENKVGLVIVDSLALACGGDLTTAETANRYDQALKQLGEVTTLTLAHTSKDILSRKKTIYGSVFFEAFSRSVWHCKKSQEPDSNEMVVGMIETKYNRKRQLPFGLRFTFDDKAGIVTAERCDLASTDLSPELPLKFRIKALLAAGPLEVKEIAEELGESEGTIRTTLNREKKLFVKVENGWGLLAEISITKSVTS